MNLPKSHSLFTGNSFSSFILFWIIFTIRSLIIAFGERKKVEEAYDLIKMIKNQEDTPTLEMYNSIIQAAAKLKNVCSIRLHFVENFF